MVLNYVLVIHERFAIAKARNNKNISDFIVIDGAEGGTGAAPVEFADNIGMPMKRPTD